MLNKNSQSSQAFIAGFCHVFVMLVIAHSFTPVAGLILQLAVGGALTLMMPGPYNPQELYLSTLLVLAISGAAVNAFVSGMHNVSGTYLATWFLVTLLAFFVPYLIFAALHYLRRLSRRTVHSV